MRSCFLAVAGNVGVGKSTLTRLLALSFGWQPFFEAVDENPYLSDFYGNMQRWSFHSQAFFLSRRVAQHKQLLERGEHVILDRSVYEDAEIFAHNLFVRGAMSSRDWDTYESLYRTLSSLLRPPDLVVYLRAGVPTLLRRIALRGRDYEQSISVDYLTALNDRYDRWASDFSMSPVLTIETDALDYVHNEADLDRVITVIRDRLSLDDRVGGR